MSAVPLPEFSTTKLYDVYSVKIRLRDTLCGGSPKNPDLIKGWIAATTEHNDATTDAQTAEAIETLLEPTEEKSWNGFPGDDSGLFIWARQVKALFKESAGLLGVFKKKRGTKDLFQHALEIKGAGKNRDRIYLGRKQPDGYYEGPIHVMTAQGPRTALKRVDYVTEPELSFDVWVFKTHAAETRHVGREDIVSILTFGQENGIGADRSQGRGKFDVIGFE